MRALRGSQIAMVFQDPARSLNPTLRIGAQITEAIHMHRKVSKAEAQDRAVELMELVRLPAARERFRQYPHQLSGGMRQRVMIAIALAGDPRLLIADEATTALDVTTQAQIMELLRDLQQRLGMALIMISHDLGLAASYADEVLVMYAGRAVERAATRTLFGQVRMPYTRALLGAIPRLENPPHTTLTAVPGQPPDLASQPPGCPFAPRCPDVTDRCRETAPPLAEQEPGHLWACWHPCGAGGRSRRGGVSVSEPLLEVTDLVQEFTVRDRGGAKAGVVHAVSGVSLRCRAGESLGLVGETGSGKSTLARAVLQAPAPKSGSVRLRGVELVGLRGRRLRGRRAATCRWSSRTRSARSIRRGR